MALFDGLSTGGALGGFTGMVSGLINIIMYVVVGIVVLSVVALFVYRRKQNKMYNIPLIILTPRSDGQVAEINYADGGFFKSAKVGGITTFRVKRKGIGIVDIPPPPSSFLMSPTRSLVLVQKGVDDYEPVLPSSLAEVWVSRNGADVKMAILKLKAINQEATAWSFDIEETAKKRFTFASIWEKYQMLISMMIFVFILFLVLYINWMGMKDVVVGLQEVANTLKGTVAPTITQGG